MKIMTDERREGLIEKLKLLDNQDKCLFAIELALSVSKSAEGSDFRKWANKYPYLGFDFDLYESIDNKRFIGNIDVRNELNAAYYALTYIMTENSPDSNFIKILEYVELIDISYSAEDIIQNRINFMKIWNNPAGHIDFIYKENEQ